MRILVRAGLVFGLGLFALSAKAQTIELTPEEARMQTLLQPSDAYKTWILKGIVGYSGTREILKRRLIIARCRRDMQSDPRMNEVYGAAADRLVTSAEMFTIQRLTFVLINASVPQEWLIRSEQWAKDNSKAQALIELNNAIRFAASSIVDPTTGQLETWPVGRLVAFAKASDVWPELKQLLGPPAEVAERYSTDPAQNGAFDDALLKRLEDILNTEDDNASLGKLLGDAVFDSFQKSGMSDIRDQSTAISEANRQMPLTRGAPESMAKVAADTLIKPQTCPAGETSCKARARFEQIWPVYAKTLSDQAMRGDKPLFDAFFTDRCEIRDGVIPASK